MARSLAVASARVSREAAEQALTEGGSAVRAALAGFFAAAGDTPGVLFSPVTLLVGGLGAGVFAFDGRARQPGREGKRPRGFLPGQQIPSAARAAAPGSIAALSVACAFHPGTSWLSCVRPGIQTAKEAGATGRQEILDRVASLGARALTDQTVRRALLASYGAVETGLISNGDLLPPENVHVSAVKDGKSYAPPWNDARSSAATEGPETNRSALGVQRSVLAVDVQGLFAALSYYELPPILHLPEYEVYMPALAVPVERGVTRIQPGVSLPAPHGLSLDTDEVGRFVSARAALSVGSESAEIPHGPAGLKLYRDPDTKEASLA